MAHEQVEREGIETRTKGLEEEQRKEWDGMETGIKRNGMERKQTKNDKQNGNET